MHQTNKYTDLLSIEYFKSDQDVDNSLKGIASESAEFNHRYKENTARLSDDCLLKAFREYVRIEEKIVALIHFANIYQEHNPTANSVVAQQIRDDATEAGKPLAFFLSDIENFSKETTDRLLSTNGFSRFHPLIRRMHVPAYRTPQVADIGAWNKKAIALVNTCRIGNEYDDKSVSELRTIIHNTILPAKIFGYSTPNSYVISKEFAEDEEIQALKAAIHERIKTFWNFNAIFTMLKDREIDPLQDVLEPNTIPWDTARRLVLAAYKNFHPELGTMVDNSDKNGAFHIMPPFLSQGITIQASRNFSPEIFLSFQGNIQDFREAAHEYGHLTQATCRNRNGHVQAMQSIFVDETCAIFGERILMEYIKPYTSGTGLSLIDAAEQISTVARFSIIDDFQTQATNLCATGKCTPQSLDMAWKEISSSYLGLPQKDIVSSNWRNEPHVLSKPYTAIAYAYGQLMCAHLWKQNKTTPETFSQNYISLLKQSSGATAHELFSILGMNTKEKRFWTSAIDTLFDNYRNAAQSAMRPYCYSRKNLMQQMLNI